MPTIGVSAMIWNATPPYKLLIGRRGQGCKRGKGMWSTPGGNAEPDEPYEKTAIRETFEETSMRIRVPLLKPFCVPGLLGVTDHRNPDFREEFRADHLTFWLRCFWIGGQPKVTEPTKCEGWQWMTPAEIVDLVGTAGENPLDEQYHWTPIPLWRAMLEPFFGAF